MPESRGNTGLGEQREQLIARNPKKRWFRGTERAAHCSKAEETLV
ncbi:hypothetical protein [Ureibacillus chungkukjangi]|nr:hypothetical protein [Ureibacillus chungkukjangi]